MEIKNINLIPEGDNPIIHASQFDENRSVRFDLKDGTDDFTLLSDLVITCNIKKVDGNIVTFEVENTESTYVVITLPFQATACAGPNIGEIVITDGETSVIGTINFILEVEKSPMLGGIESASDIHDLEEQIDVIVTQVIATDYYTKTEVDNLLNEKADVSDLPDMDNYYDKSSVDTLLNGKANVSDLPDMSNYYNKTQVDNKLDQKANISDLPDMSDYYDKSDVNALLAEKADISDLPDMSNYYTKTQIDNMFLDIMPVNSASGAIANFTTLIVAPLEGLKTYIVAQGGGGTPSSPVPITGFSEITLTCADEDMQTVDTFTLSLGQTVYGGYVDWGNGKGYVIWGSSKISDIAWTRASGAQSPSGYVFRTSSPIAKPRERYNPNNILCSIFTTDTSDWFVANIDNYNMMIDDAGRIYIRDDDYDNDVTAFVNALGDTVLYFELATPIEISIPTTMPSTISGVQNWFADSGDIDISFKQNIQNYVDSKVSAANVNRSLSMISPVTTEESKGDEDER